MLVDGAMISLDRATRTAPREHAGRAVVDLDGALVTPAFVDAHVHATGDRPGADRARSAPGARSLREALDLRRTRRPRRPRPSGPRRRLGRDAAGPSSARRPRPNSTAPATAARVYLARVDAHSAVVSSALLAAVPGLARAAGLPRRRAA